MLMSACMHECRFVRRSRPSMCSFSTSRQRLLRSVLHPSILEFILCFSPRQSNVLYSLRYYCILFLFCVGYMEHFCRVLRESLEKLPGDARTQLAVVTYDASSVHLYVLQTTQQSAPAATSVPSNSSTVVSDRSSANSVSSAVSAGSAASTSAAQTQSAAAAAAKRLFRMLVVTDIDDLWEDASMDNDTNWLFNIPYSYVLWEVTYVSHLLYEYFVLFSV